MSVWFEVVGADESAPTTNASNTNAVSVLQALGLMTDADDFGDVCVGSCSPENFLGRVLIAEAVATNSYVGRSAGNVSTVLGNVYDCGTDDNYLADKLSQLRTLAEYAVATNREVVWS